MSLSTRRHLRRPLLAALCLTLAIPVHAATDRARLDGNVAPVAQAVRLTLDPSTAEFTGSVQIDLKASAKADSFQFNSRGMKIGALRLAGPAGPIATTWNEAKFERISVHTAQAMAPGSYTLEIEFSRAWDEKATGLYRLKAGDDWYGFTQFESADARQAFPCWDEPEFKIPWTMTLSVPKALLVIANTPEASRTEQDGLAVVTFKTSQPMPSYLVAFAVGPFETTPIAGMSIPGRVLTVKGQKGMTGEAVRMTPPILAALEKYFGSRYPFEKLDLISVPEYNFGAMENPGAITFAERLLSLDAAGTTNSQRRYLAATLAHELAHMWFGDLVTMKWWNDLWLNESFASWMGDKITDMVYPEYKMPIEELGGKNDAYRTDDHLSTHAMRMQVDENTNLEQLADALAYQKGQAVLGMFESWIGPEAFRAGVISYLEAHKWGNAEGADLWRALSRASGKDLDAVMASFLDQPGVPMVTAEPLAGGRVRLSQQRFLAYGETAPTAQTWKIPVVMRFSDGTKTYTQAVLLGDPVMTVQLKPAVKPVWIHPNADERGYYHWSVSPELLGRITQQARPQLTERERVGLLNNLNALLSGGVLHGDDYLRSIAAFGNDPSEEVVGAVVEGLQGVRFAFVTADLRDAYASYIRHTLKPALERLGETPKPGEGPSVSALRARLMGQLGVNGQDQALRQWGLETTRAMLADPASVDPSMVDVAMRLAATTNDTTLYYEFRRRFEAAKTPNDRRRYLTALGTFHAPELVDETLHYALTGPLRPQEVMFGFMGFDTPELADKTWSWAQANYDQIAAKIPPMFRVYLVYFAMGCSRERLEAAKAFFSQPEHAPMGTEQELAKVGDRITECASLRDREGARVAKMLTEMQAAQ